ncbi:MULTISPECIES: hypothetical protein [Bacillus cereus group]|uniref:hypothetical protein n=1 Tax=Bacillus cereus group TaxID=86661 RepID=UPI000D0F4296|nr:hypothetical protein [Bacillus cereus]AVP47684.1 hypothetical protein C2I25_22640 [Bacillus cereus]MED3467486.1 hypothetical protein [Bacillus thuringiensis]
MVVILYFIGVFFVFLFVCIYIKIIKEDKFVKNITSASKFHKEVKNYKGYVICTEKNGIINEVNLLKNIVTYINKKEKCTIVNLSNDIYSENVDMKLIGILKIKTVPTILYMENGTVVREVINFGDFQGEETNKEIIKKIKNKLSEIEYENTLYNIN